MTPPSLYTKDNKSVQMYSLRTKYESEEPGEAQQLRWLEDFGLRLTVDVMYLTSVNRGTQFLVV